MSMLTLGSGQALEQAERPARISSTRKAQLKHIVLRALTVLAMGGVLAALIALKTAFYVWHMHA